MDANLALNVAKFIAKFKFTAKASLVETTIALYIVLKDCTRSSVMNYDCRALHGANLYMDDFGLEVNTSKMRCRQHRSVSFNIRPSCR
ncbi:hypothetical protein AVEN_95489-1 [Araneus ventricosus]|uniref:Uncharacterized protein n=1 Tax=Araneus ventricosus TaxID=182803 RepID=A0A4Y2WRZ9_ARAVE|nr:hypothetical protein AVEN_95489-1 [Araneus ventricosus]